MNLYRKSFRGQHHQKIFTVSDTARFEVIFSSAKYDVMKNHLLRLNTCIINIKRHIYDRLFEQLHHSYSGLKKRFLLFFINILRQCIIFIHNFQLRVLASNLYISIRNFVALKCNFVTLIFFSSQLVLYIM